MVECCTTTWRGICDALCSCLFDCCRRGRGTNPGRTQIAMGWREISFTLAFLLSGGKQWRKSMFLTHPRYLTRTRDKILYFLSIIILINLRGNCEKKAAPEMFMFTMISIWLTVKTRFLWRVLCLADLFVLVVVSFCCFLKLLLVSETRYQEDGNSSIIPSSLQNLEIIFPALLRISISSPKEWQKNMCPC